jgi:hypothetical protein
MDDRREERMNTMSQLTPMQNQDIDWIEAVMREKK